MLIPKLPLLRATLSLLALAVRASAQANMSVNGLFVGDEVTVNPAVRVLNFKPTEVFFPRYFDPEDFCEPVSIPHTNVRIVGSDGASLKESLAYRDKKDDSGFFATAHVIDVNNKFIKFDLKGPTYKEITKVDKLEWNLASSDCKSVFSWPFFNPLSGPAGTEFLLYCQQKDKILFYNSYTNKSFGDWTMSQLPVTSEEEKSLGIFRKFPLNNNKIMGYNYFSFSNNTKVMFILPSEQFGAVEKVIDIGEAVFNANVIKLASIFDLQIHRLNIAENKTLLTIFGAINDEVRNISIIYDCEFDFVTLEVSLCVEIERNETYVEYNEISVLRHASTDIQGETQTTFQLIRKDQEEYLSKTIDLFQLIDSDGKRGLVRIDVGDETEHKLSQAANLGPTYIKFLKHNVKAYYSKGVESKENLRFFEVNVNLNQSYLLYDNQIDAIFLSTANNLTVGISITESLVSFYSPEDSLYLKINTSRMIPDPKTLVNSTKIFFFNSTIEDFGFINLTTSFLTYEIKSICPSNQTVYLTNSSRPIQFTATCFDSPLYKLTIDAKEVLPPLPTPETVTSLDYFMFNGTDLVKGEEGPFVLTFSFLIHFKTNKIHACSMGYSGTAICSPDGRLLRDQSFGEVLITAVNDHWVAVNELKDEKDCYWVGRMKANQNIPPFCMDKDITVKKTVEILMGQHGIYFFSMTSTGKLRAEFFDYESQKFSSTGVLVDDPKLEAFYVGKVEPDSKIYNFSGADVSVTIAVGPLFLIKDLRGGFVVETDSFVPPDGGRPEGSMLYSLSDFLIYVTQRAVFHINTNGELFPLYTTEETLISFSERLAILDGRLALLFHDSTKTHFNLIRPFRNPAANRRSLNLVYTTPFKFNEAYSSFTVANTLYIWTQAKTYIIPQPSSTISMAANGSLNRSLIVYESADPTNNISLSLRGEFVETLSNSSWQGLRNNVLWSVSSKKHFWRIDRADLSVSANNATEGRRFFREKAFDQDEDYAYGWVEATDIFVKVGKLKVMKLNVVGHLSQKPVAVVSVSQKHNQKSAFSMVLRLDLGVKHGLGLLDFKIDKNQADVYHSNFDFCESLGVEDFDIRVNWIPEGPIISYQESIENQTLVVVNAQTNVEVVEKSYVSKFDVFTAHRRDNINETVFVMFASLQHTNFSLIRVNYNTGETSQLQLPALESTAAFDRIFCVFTSEDSFGCLFAGIKILWKHFKVAEDGSKVSVTATEEYKAYKNMVVQKMKLTFDHDKKRLKHFIVSGSRINYNSSRFYDSFGILYYKGLGFEGSGYASGGLAADDLIANLIPGRVRFEHVNDNLIRVYAGYSNIFYRIAEPTLTLSDLSNAYEVKVLGESGIEKFSVLPSRSFKTVLMVIGGVIGFMLLLSFCLCYAHRRPAYYDRKDVYYEGETTMIKDNEL